MAHIVLLGDSIFDNAAYLPAGTEVGLPGIAAGTAAPHVAAGAHGSVLEDMAAGNDVLGLLGTMHSSTAARGSLQHLKISVWQHIW